MENINLKIVSKCCFATILLALFFAAAPAHAQSKGASNRPSVYFDTTFFPVLVEQNDTGGAATDTVPKESGFGYDFRTTLAYNVWGAMYLGLSYNMYNLSTEQPAVTGIPGREQETSKSELGPTVAAFWGQARFALTYFVMGNLKRATRDFDTTATTADVTLTNKDISGFQFLVGYSFPVWKGLQIGPSLVYRTVKYKKQKKDVAVGADPSYDSTLTSPKIEADLNPMITILYAF